MEDETIKKIQQLVLDSGRDRRFPIEAYKFVIDGLEFYTSKTGTHRHACGKTISRTLIEFAIVQFGPLTKTVLANWQVKKTEDFGAIIFNLIDLGLMQKSESDDLQDFNDLFDFNAEIAKHQFYKIDKDFIKSIQGA